MEHGLWSPAELGSNPDSSLASCVVVNKLVTSEVSFLPKTPSGGLNLLINILWVSIQTHQIKHLSFGLSFCILFPRVSWRIQPNALLKSLCRACGHFLICQSKNPLRKENEPGKGHLSFEGHTWGNAKWKKFIFLLTATLSCFLYPVHCPLFQAAEFPFIVSFKQAAVTLPSMLHSPCTLLYLLEGAKTPVCQSFLTNT